MQSIPSLPSLPGPLRLGVVAPDRVLSIGQIELNYVLVLNWFLWNRTVLHWTILTFNCLQRKIKLILNRIVWNSIIQFQSLNVVGSETVSPTWNGRRFTKAQIITSSIKKYHSTFSWFDTGLEEGWNALIKRVVFFLFVVSRTMSVTEQTFQQIFTF